jgi:hypothetical protein
VRLNKSIITIAAFLPNAGEVYVTRIEASAFDTNTVYVAFDNHRWGDFKPYLLKTTDAGRTWTSLSASLPKNGPVWAIAEDHVDPNLLFVGTEFGPGSLTESGYPRIVKSWKRRSSARAIRSLRTRRVCRRENSTRPPATLPSS